MAKEFLRTLCTKYLCDELCHTVGAKEFLRTLKEGTPRAKAERPLSMGGPTPALLCCSEWLPFSLGAAAQSSAENKNQRRKQTLGKLVNFDSTGYGALGSSPGV